MKWLIRHCNKLWPTGENCQLNDTDCPLVTMSRQVLIDSVILWLICHLITERSFMAFDGERKLTNPHLYNRLYSEPVRKGY